MGIKNNTHEKGVSYAKCGEAVHHKTSTRLCSHKGLFA